jgi:hypothetical protein
MVAKVVTVEAEAAVETSPSRDIRAILAHSLGVANAERCAGVDSGFGSTVSRLHCPIEIAKVSGLHSEDSTDHRSTRRVSTMLTEADVQVSFRRLFQSGAVDAKTIEQAEAMLHELRAESPLRHRLSEELEEVRRIRGFRR